MIFLQIKQLFNRTKLILASEKFISTQHTKLNMKDPLFVNKHHQQVKTISIANQLPQITKYWSAKRIPTKREKVKSNKIKIVRSILLVSTQIKKQWMWMVTIVYPVDLVTLPQCFSVHPLPLVHSRTLQLEPHALHLVQVVRCWNSLLWRSRKETEI